MASTPPRRTDVWSITNSGAGDSFERLFGDSEAAFYPASKAGLGDMFLHLAFTAPKQSMRPERVKIGWAIIRRRHPMLMCRVVDDVEGGIPYFSFIPPTGVTGALDEAGHALFFINSSKDEMIYEYMNGPRVLSDAHISRLVISSHSPPSSPSGPDTASVSDNVNNARNDDNTVNENAEYDLLMCAPHFLGDGTSLHQATHDLFVLLASSLSDAQLREELVDDEVDWPNILPPAFETRISVPTGRFAKAVSKVDFIRALEKEIGGHTLPRTQRAPQSTVLHETSFSEEDTAKILSKCKANGVTVNHAIVALCNVAWARTMGREVGKELPLMMYTAISLRPYLSSLPHQSSTTPPTYWFIALTYFNIVLPAFLPASQSVLWHRARDVKSQIRKMVCSPFLKSRALEMGGIRVARARGQNAEMPSLTDSDAHNEASRKWTPGPAPSKALLGLSLIGNLDATYTRASYPSFNLTSVTTASKQKAGGMLLLEHTFGKKLWLHLCWDENGFEEGSIEGWWKELQGVVKEFLV